MALKCLLLPSLLVLAIVVVQYPANGVAPGDENPLCSQLRDLGAISKPEYSDNMRVLMDSWSYSNLLPTGGRTGAVWEQVDNDSNNPVGLSSYVSRVFCQACNNINAGRNKLNTTILNNDQFHAVLNLKKYSL